MGRFVVVNYFSYACASSVFIAILILYFSIKWQFLKWPFNLKVEKYSCFHLVVIFVPLLTIVIFFNLLMEKHIERSGFFGGTHDYYTLSQKALTTKNAAYLQVILFNVKNLHLDFDCLLTCCHYDHGQDSWSPGPFFLDLDSF